jgi:mRNA interferase HigB
MHVIAAKTLKAFSEKHTDARVSLMEWLSVAEKAKWNSINDIRLVFPKTDSVKLPSGNTVYVFNVEGNEYRLIVAIHFNRGKVYILGFMTHPEYDKQAWKRRL